MLEIAENVEYKMCHLSWISKTNPNEKEYAFILVPIDKIKKLEEKTQSMQDYKLEDYGIVVESGIGEPTPAVFTRIKNEFHCDF